MRVILGFLLLGLSAGACRAQIEKDPYHEAIVVTAEYGTAPDQFGELNLNEQSIGPGPFYVTDDGIFIADRRLRNLKIYDPAGVWQRSIALPEGAKWIDDIAVIGDRVYYLGQHGLFHHYVLFATDVTIGESEEIPIRSGPDMTGQADQRRGRVSGICWLLVSDGALHIYNEKNGNGRLIVTAEGSAVSADAPSFGRQAGQEVIGPLQADQITARGEQGRKGDLVAVRDGQVVRVVRPDAGMFTGVDGAGNLAYQRMFEKGGKEVWALQFMSLENELLSSTLMPRRPLVGRVSTGPSLRIMPDGTYYELWLTEQAVHVSRWSR